MAKLKLPLGIVLAGGEGKRLMPLTADRAKPAVPFGGSYRLIDFVLSNLVNANMLKVAVLTQYKSHSLDRHITTTWRMSALLGNYITPVPAQQRLGPRWYTGSADAILQNFNLIHDENPKHVLVFGADHVYRMDPGQMFEQHVESGAGVTVAAIRMPRSEAHEFGVIELADDGITIKGVAKVYDFANNVVPGETDRDKGYWRDVGSIDAYYDAHMDLVSVHPIFNLYNRDWPLLTNPPSLPPAKFSEGGAAHDSIVGAGTIISGGILHNSVISYDVSVGRGSLIEGSVLMPSVTIGDKAIIRNAILDKNVYVEPGAQIGVDLERDRQRFTISPGGVIVVCKGVRVTS